MKMVVISLAIALSIFLQSNAEKFSSEEKETDVKIKFELIPL